MEYWAKTTFNGTPGINVHEHMCHVGHVARILALQNPELIDFLGLDVSGIASLAASHDIGKISQGFQQKCQAWIEQNHLQEQAKREGWNHCESDHSKVSQFSLYNFLRQQGMSPNSAGLWAAAVGGHHGRLHKAGEKGLTPAAGMRKDEWEDERQNALKFLKEEFGNMPALEIDQDTAALWWLAGLTSVADWIGSDERFFPTDLPASDAGAKAQEAIEQVGLLAPKIRRHLNFKSLFELNVPNSLQKAAVEFITSPGLYVIEAPMGMGKTEAALWSAYNLLRNGKASGIYFALPTQATSNRIHLRMCEFINRAVEEDVYTRLIHGNSWLMDNISIPQSNLITDHGNETGEAIVRDWFASGKRALLAPFGVGTVDQALLGIVAARHFFVRRFALAGKVVIIDEVHSYDVYTGTLVDILCRELEKLGCTVILLSATLTRSRCAKLFGNEAIDEVDVYPLLTGRKWGNKKPINIPVSLSSSGRDHSLLCIAVDFRKQEKAVEEAVKAARIGGCVLWICDTVSSAQASYESMRVLAADGIFEIGLLHSRFPFYRREELENYWMEKLGKRQRRGGGCILISTQVVEQSVDLDADLMVSELAPTDMLLQRLGRLWRHKRENRPIESPCLIILEENCGFENMRSLSAVEIKQILGSKAWVYAPYILLRSWEVFLGVREGISLPLEIRKMLRATYEERTEESDGMIALANEWFGNDYAKKQKADWETNVFQILLDDVEGVNTRLNERPMVSLVLAEKVTEERSRLMDGSYTSNYTERFDLETARALNRNIVRVPRSALVVEGTLPIHRVLDKYVSGEACWALIGADGLLEVPGIGMTRRKLRYTNEIGLEIIKRGDA